MEFVPVYRVHRHLGEGGEAGGGHLNSQRLDDTNTLAMCADISSRHYVVPIVRVEILAVVRLGALVNFAFLGANNKQVLAGRVKVEGRAAS